jgi:hypothetical protein
MTTACKVSAHVVAASTEISDSFLLGRRWRHRGQDAGATQFRELSRVAAIVGFARLASRE